MAVKFGQRIQAHQREKLSKNEWLTQFFDILKMKSESYDNKSKSREYVT